MIFGGFIDETGFERAGELAKLSKKREFKKKYFELSKKQLIYYKPKEKGDLLEKYNKMTKNKNR